MERRRCRDKVKPPVPLKGELSSKHSNSVYEFIEQYVDNCVASFGSLIVLSLRRSVHLLVLYSTILLITSHQSERISIVVKCKSPFRGLGFIWKLLT